MDFAEVHALRYPLYTQTECKPLDLKRLFYTSEKKNHLSNTLFYIGFQRVQKGYNIKLDL